MLRDTKRASKSKKNKGNVNYASPSRADVMNSPGVGLASLPYVSAPSKIYRIIERASADNQIAQSMGTAVVGAYRFTLGSVLDALSYQAVFQQYKIEMVEITITPRYTEATQQTPSTTAILPRLYTAIDYTDAAPPGNINGVKDYSNCVVTPPGGVCKRTIIPQCSSALYSGAFTSYGSSTGWVDVTSPNVEWYGLIYALEAGSANTNLQSYLVDMVYYIAFRNQG